MKVGIGLKSSTYTPEAFAYSKYLEAKGWDVQLVPEVELSRSLDIHIYFMGLRPFWINKSKGEFAEIHEYHSLSTPPYARFKDTIKRSVNSKPSGRIFLNSVVKKSLGFSDDVSFIFRDMGVDQELFLTPSINPEFDLIYCGSVSGRPGLVEEIVRLARLGFTILLVGDVDRETMSIFAPFKGIHLTGRVRRAELPALFKSVRAGINYTPDVYPFNIQTSTKTLEYCAAGLGVLSNRYYWIEEFSSKNNVNVMWLESLSDKKMFESFEFNHADVRRYEWGAILESAGFDSYLASIVR